MLDLRARCPLVVLASAFAIQCGAGSRDSVRPLSPAAAKVIVQDAAPTGCRRVGSVQGSGHESDMAASGREASDGAKEAAVALGGDTLVFTGQASATEAGEGGSRHRVTKRADVFRCHEAKAP